MRKRNPKALGVARNPVWLSLPPTPNIPSPMRSELAPVNGISIYFAQFGDAGPPLLLLHGGLGNSNYWGHQITELAKRFSVTVMDTRGHGRSPLTSRAFSYGLFAQDAVGLLDFLQIPAAAVVGWSDGAITGLQLAIAKPDRISKLFAFGANSTLGGLKPDGFARHCACLRPGLLSSPAVAPSHLSHPYRVVRRRRDGVTGIRAVADATTCDAKCDMRRGEPSE